MKKLFLLILLIAVACQTAPLTSATNRDLLQTSWDDRSVFRDGLSASYQSILDQLPGASVYHIEYRIADDLYHVNGFEEVHYTNREILPLNEVQFHLFPNILGGAITISNLLVNGKPATPKYELLDSLMRVPLSLPLEPDQSIVIHMDFEVTVPRTVENNYGVLAFTDGVLALAHAYPLIVVYDTKGWEAEIPSPQGDLVYSDASFYIVRIAAPKNLVIAATGRKIQQETMGHEQIAAFALGPARDFYLAASPDYRIKTRTVGGVTINSFAPAPDQDGAQIALDVASRSISDYGQLYAPYPYTQLNIVSTPTLALGIEYPGQIAVAERIYAPNSSQQGTPNSVYMESTVAHEAAHQWFYNLVGNDQLDEPWLDEALAQFATLEYYTTEYGIQAADGFRQSLEARWSRVNDARIALDQPVAAFRGQEYGAIVYGRGPLFFDTLQHQMGQQAFNRFLKDYVASNAWKIATTDGLKAAAEKNCSCDLTPIFNEWVYPN